MEPRELVVPPGGEAAVLVRVLLDDAAVFRDTLHLLVSDGADVCVPLEASGVGATVVCAALSQPGLDFGAQLVGRPWQRDVEVTNLGRKAVTLAWTNTRLAEVLGGLTKAAKAAGKKVEPGQVPPEQAPVFAVAPDKALLPPKEAVCFTISGAARKPGAVREQLLCFAASAGAPAGGASKAKPLFDVALTADVTAPLLALSQQALSFAYIHAAGSRPEVMTQQLDIRCGAVGRASGCALAGRPRAGAPGCRC